jgi:hypothetical protein
MDEAARRALLDAGEAEAVTVNQRVRGTSVVGCSRRR